MSYRDLRSVRLFGMPGWSYYGTEAAPPNAACTIVPKEGRPCTVCASHARVDGRAQYCAFVGELLKRLEAFPTVSVYGGWSRPLWSLYLLACAVLWSASLFFLAMAVGGLVFLFQRKWSFHLFLFLIGAGASLFFVTGNAITFTRLLRAEKLRRLK